MDLVYCMFVCCMSSQAFGRELQLDNKEYILILYEVRTWIIPIYIFSMLTCTSSCDRFQLNFRQLSWFCQSWCLLQLILRVPDSDTGGVMEAELLFQCLRYAFFKRKEYSNDRVAAFIKRLMAVSIPLDVGASLGIIACTRGMFLIYSSQYDTEAAAYGSSVYIAS